MALKSKSHVITNREKLDRFFKFGGKLNDVVVSVGILTGKPKYPQGHVGSKSRKKRRDDPSRRRVRTTPLQLRIRGMRQHIRGIDNPAMRKLEIKRLRAQLKAEKLSSKGLGRRKAGPVAVAKVAGVMGAYSRYHSRGIESMGFRAGEKRRGVVVFEIRKVGEAVTGARDYTSALKNLGKNAKAAVRRNLVSSRHVDTGRLLRNTQYQIVSQAEKRRITAQEKLQRKRKRVFKAAQKQATRATKTASKALAAAGRLARSRR
jgi:hypothetical protein